MNDTNVDNSGIAFKEKIKIFYEYSKQSQKIGYCPVQDILAPSVDKWSLFIIYNLAYNGVLRFNQMRALVPQISSRMLSVTLKKLEASEIVCRKAYNEIPPKVEYSLSEFGMQYSQKLIDLNLWLIEQSPSIKRNSKH